MGAKHSKTKKGDQGVEDEFPISSEDVKYLNCKRARLDCENRLKIELENGNQATKEQKVDEAKANFESAYECLKTLKYQMSSISAILENNLAAIAFQKGDYSHAKQLLMEIVPFVRQNAQSNQIEISENIDPHMNMFEMVLIHHQRNEMFVKTPLSQDNFVNLTVEFCPDNKLQLANVLDNMAAIEEATNSIEAAKCLYEESLQLRRDKHPTQSPRLLESMENVAIMNAAESNWNIAETIYHESLEISKALYGNGSLISAALLNNYSVILSKLNRIVEAMELMTEALKYRHEKLGMDHTLTICAMQNLAYLRNQLTISDPTIITLVNKTEVTEVLDNMVDAVNNQVMPEEIHDMNNANAIS